MEQQMIKKPKYIVYAEQAQQRKEKKLKDAFESVEFQQYLENRKRLNLPDIPQNELYTRFKISQRQRKYRQNKEQATWM